MAPGAGRRARLRTATIDTLRRPEVDLHQGWPAEFMVEEIIRIHVADRRDTAMRTDLLEKIAEKIDLLFVVAMAVAIGLAAVNLALQLNDDQAAFDAVATGQKLGQVVYQLPLDSV
jgi:hypothetical protein